MNITEKELVYNSKHYTVMANDIIKGKQDMTLQEARIIRLLVTQVVKEDNDLQTYTCRITDLAKFLNVDSSNLYRDIKYICVNLAQRVVQIGTGNPKQPWEIFSWISSSKYDGNGSVTLRLSDNLKPYLLDLNAYFTQYQLENILEMKSFYSIRLYELLKSDFYTSHHTFCQEYTVLFLREFFDCEKKYPRYGNFKARIIQIAVKEINEKSDLFIRNVEEIKTGRKITSISFMVSENYVRKYGFLKNHDKTQL